MRNKIRGFTLFELLVSVSIIGILVALASVSFSAAQKKARDARRMEDMKMMQTAAEQYYSMASYQYPTERRAGQPWITPNGQTVLESIPRDPMGIDYTFPTSTATSYVICAWMENSANANADGSGNMQAAAEDKQYFCVKSQQ